MSTKIRRYFQHLTCTLFVVLGLLGIFAPASQAATGAFAFSTATYAVNEGAGKINMTINRVGGSTGAASVSFRTNPISATAGSDFVSIPLTTLNFAHRERQKVVSVNIINDTIVEPAETFAVILSNPTYGTTLGSTSSAVVTIQDNDVVTVDTSAPTVSLTSPTSATTFTSAQTVTIAAAASDNVGVSKVELYNGTALLATDTTAPHSFAWAISSAHNGNHSLTAKAYDTTGNSKVSSATAVTVNIPVPDLTAPTVSITSPANATIFTTAQTVTIAASASDNVGVSKVELYNGTALLATDTTAPHSFAWAITSANNGSHSLTVKAYDAAGNSTVSTVAVTVNIPVQDLSAPTVSLTNPTAGTTFTSAQTVTIAANASDNVGVSRVEFYNGTTLLKNDTTSPYFVDWAISSANNGSHNLSAKAYDAAGNSTVSTVTVTVNIAVQDLSAPTVSLSSPAAGTTFTSAQTVTITANASDNVGVSRVEFYNGATLLKNDTTSPYDVPWTISSANNGIHTLTAKAYDAAGNSKVSSAVIATVNIPVQDLSAPTVSLTSPTAGTTFTSAQTVRIAASATSSTGVSKVDFYNGTTLLKNDTTSPYFVDWAITNANNGNHNLTAKAYDAAGNVTNAATVAININIAEDTPIYDSSTRTPLSLRIDPSFTVDSLPADTRLWYNRFLAGMRNPNQYPNATVAAQSNNTYRYGRTMNTHMTTIMQMLRVTGDRQLLDEVDRLTQLMRAQLKDWSITTYGSTTYKTDGYLNWQYDYDAGYTGTDVHEMDEMLTHSLVASYAYAFHVNRDLDPRYAERAQFWTNYLKNHFEAKWRKRKNIPTGFPFLEKKLAHPYMQFVRYHYYMAKLTGDKAYETEALRMTGNIKNQIKEVSTPIGTSAIWAHGMTLLGGTATGIQSTSYARYTVQGAAEMAAEGFSIFGQAGYMDRVAVTLANNIMDGNLSAYAEYIDGSGSGGAQLDTYAISPWAMLGRWDKTGEVQVETDRVYRKFESSPENPKRIYLPAGMVYLLTR